MNDADFWKNEAVRARQEQLTTFSQLQAATAKLKRLEDERDKVKEASEELNSWRSWYPKIERKAPGKLLKTLNRWGFKALPPARDRCWGGGQ